MIQSVTAAQSKLRRLDSYPSDARSSFTSKDSQTVLSKLPLLLQTTLNLNQLLKIFHQQITPVLALGGMRYQQAEQGLDLKLGHPEQHKCNYQLEIDEQRLGKLTLSRNFRFSDSEIHLIEDLICKLVYPLRNSLFYQQALDAAMTDALTGMHNRQAFDINLNREIELSRRLNLPMSLLVIDIDNFKDINDTYGHSSGDRALTLTAQALTQSLRSSDLTFRYGGEEFTAILRHLDATPAQHAAERIRSTVATLLCNDGNGIQTFSLTVSIGIAALNEKDTSFRLFDRADQALYQAKCEGRNRIALAH